MAQIIPIGAIPIAALIAEAQRKGVSSRYMRCMTTASFLVTAILAFFRLLRCAICMPQTRIAVHCRDRVNITWAAVKSAVRVRASPERDMRPRTSVSPD